ncbi:hypothetical protein J2129_001816 [Methanofollis sp. W23]|uniref:hypothetical protein n=1 Tax=Methanofollis sp. W23 TaxID=2817849 RepID=UPI001AE556BD|nr:hypothetical protein [Methanofollis sp. W23]MBP2146362.1 hypothetical protein [Methanofollis sp. W23]
MQTDPDPTAAFTRLECGILAAVILLAAGVVIYAETRPAEAPAGMVVGTLDLSGHAVLIEDLYGHADEAGPGRMGAVSCSVRLFPGDMGGVDMGKAVVGFETKTEEWSLTKDAPTPPAWTITTRVNVPLFKVDDDDLLEPGEVFVLLATPGRTLGPGETFTLSVAPPGAVAASAVRTVPLKMTGVMELG